jgi:hypothetical protein
MPGPKIKFLKNKNNKKINKKIKIKYIFLFFFKKYNKNNS